MIPHFKVYGTESTDDAGRIYSGPLINAIDFESANIVLDYLKDQGLLPPSAKIVGEFVDGFDLADLGNV